MSCLRYDASEPQELSRNERGRRDAGPALVASSPRKVVCRTLSVSACNPRARARCEKAALVPPASAVARSAVEGPLTAKSDRKADMEQNGGTHAQIGGQSPKRTCDGGRDERTREGTRGKKTEGAATRAGCGHGRLAQQNCVGCDNRSIDLHISKGHGIPVVERMAQDPRLVHDGKSRISDD